MEPDEIFREQGAFSTENGAINKDHGALNFDDGLLSRYHREFNKNHGALRIERRPLIREYDPQCR